MLQSDKSLSTVLIELSHFWKRQGIACPPIEQPYAQSVLAANGVVLPSDFLQLYCAVNGTPELYPNWLDENYCSYLPIEALRTEHKEVLVTTDGVAKSEWADVTVFVDFMHRSWEYGFIPNAKGDGYRIGIMASHNEFKVISTFLIEFLQWYLDDADVLYEPL